MTNWNKAQTWERDWWGTCQNTYGEEEKQLLYAKRMGLEFFHDRKSPYNIKGMTGVKVVDLGGGPASLLLKCPGVIGVVVDPLSVPDWVKGRYNAAGINLYQQPAEQALKGMYDEAWIYNCLQHTQDPEKIIRNAQKAAKLIRIFEWLETSVNDGHPYTFTEGGLNDLLTGEGKVELLQGEANFYGKCYYGIFPTETNGTT